MPEAVVGADLEGARFDLALARVADCSRSHARRLVDEGEATLDGVVVAARTKVAAGQVIAHPELEEVTHEPDPNVEVSVLWEDEHAAVIDKPAGLVVHAGAGRRVSTLAQGLVARWPEMLEVGEPGRWGLVHRLDRDTSGALLVAKTVEALDALQGALRRREVGREYLALIEGHPGAPTGTIDAPVDRDPVVPTRRRVDPNGRPARTHYRVKEEFGDGDLTLMDVRLETGRTHQIRVHFAAIGHPVVADRVYRSTTTPSLGLHRTWLHAARLTFPHPVTGEVREVVSPLPDELVATLADLRA
ncbi:MAG: RluA family pseudouridine synthase [Acidimicrobiia bacterium]|nr:RluA family pseudouridine synthase [Acidimicrobiia bacterium]